jgi:hypothetical protein
MIPRDIRAFALNIIVQTTVRAMANFHSLQDIVIILTSSCTRFMPSRRGYTRVNGGIGGPGSGRSARDSEAENRLIDELNEEWDDEF